METLERCCNMTTLQLLLQLVATSGGAVVFVVINCGVSGVGGSMQSEKEVRSKGIVTPPCHIHDLETCKTHQEAT